MAFNVKGKTALVTGAGSGICLEFSKLLLERGCNVLAADLALRPEAEEAFNKYQKGSPRVVFQKTDVADWKQLRAAFDKAVEEFGDLDIVNPGAGTFEPEWTNFWYPTSGVDSDETSSYKIFDLNISHPIRASQLAIDYFKRLHKSPLTGAIVHISSIAAQMPLLPVPLYSASKHAISAFVRSLAPLESVGIRVNAVAPGIVKTPLWTDEKLAWVDDSVDKWVTTKEVAEAMLSLIEDKDMVGGTVLEIGVNKTRKVEELNDPGPGSEGHTVAKVADAFANVFKNLDENFGK